MRVTILEMHSRKSQAQRQKTSDAFKNAINGIMFTSDVSARGMDYPDVTRIIQV
jgi:ATP-dependent RNA helicase MSS116